MTKSYFARYRATGTSCLIGGVKVSQSCRYGEREDAEFYLQQTLNLNRESGIACEGEIGESHQAPEIFRHCPGIAQSVNCICPTCGHLLTREMAAQHISRTKE